MDTSWAVTNKVKQTFTLQFPSWEKWKHIHTEFCTGMFKVALFIIAKIRKQTKCPLPGSGCAHCGPSVQWNILQPSEGTSTNYKRQRQGRRDLYMKATRLQESASWVAPFKWAYCKGKATGTENTSWLPGVGRGWFHGSTRGLWSGGRWWQSVLYLDCDGSVTGCVFQNSEHCMLKSDTSSM